MVDIFADEGISGGKDEKGRPGIAAALDSIRSGRASMLIVKHADRLSRDSDFAGYLKVEVRKSGGRLEIIMGVSAPSHIWTRETGFNPHAVEDWAETATQIWCSSPGAPCN